MKLSTCFLSKSDKQLYPSQLLTNFIRRLTGNLYSCLYASVFWQQWTAGHQERTKKEKISSILKLPLTRTNKPLKICHTLGYKCPMNELQYNRLYDRGLGAETKKHEWEYKLALWVAWRRDREKEEKHTVDLSLSTSCCENPVFHWRPLSATVISVLHLHKAAEIVKVILVFWLPPWWVVQYEHYLHV